MNKILSLLLVLGLCVGLVGCSSSNKFSEYTWGEYLQDELNKLGISNITDIKESIPSGSSNTVFVDFKGNDEFLTAYLSVDNGVWELISLCNSINDKYYFDKYNKENVYNINTKELIAEGSGSKKYDEENSDDDYTFTGMSKSTLAYKFKEAGYEEFADGDVYKYTWGENNEYSMRFDLELKYVEFVISNTLTSHYYWNEDTGAIGTCKYDYSKMEAYNGTTCTAEEITELKSLKDGIEKALSKIGLSIRDLNKD